MMFKPNKKFKKDYDRLFKEDPVLANVLLLLAELADENGQIISNEDELFTLYNLRFEDPEAYQL